MLHQQKSMLPHRNWRVREAAMGGSLTHARAQSNSFLHLDSTENLDGQQSFGTGQLNYSPGPRIDFAVAILQIDS